MRLCRAGLREPFAVNGKATLGVDGDIAVGVVRCGPAHPDRLVPAVHPGNGVGVYGEGEVLVHADVGPPDALGVRVGRGKRRDALAPGE